VPGVSDEKVWCRRLVYLLRIWPGMLRHRVNDRTSQVNSPGTPNSDFRRLMRESKGGAYHTSLDLGQRRQIRHSLKSTYSCLSNKYGQASYTGPGLRRLRVTRVVTSGEKYCQPFSAISAAFSAVLRLMSCTAPKTRRYTSHADGQATSERYLRAWAR
jgi:hypothetical protein